MFLSRGQIITNLGDNLGAELGNCLPIFLERLRNEITRLTTVKALTMIADSPLRIDLRPILVSRVDYILQYNWDERKVLLYHNLVHWCSQY